MEVLGTILAKQFHSILDQMATLMTVSGSWAVRFWCHVVPDNDLTALFGSLTSFGRIFDRLSQEDTCVRFQNGGIKT